MKLKTLIENLKFYKNQGHKQVTLDIDDILNCLSEVTEVKKIKAQKTLVLDADGGTFG
jgi:hypothetical protein